MIWNYAPTDPAQHGLCQDVQAVLRDYRAWHDQYDDPASSLAQRLRIVQKRLAELLLSAPPGPIRVVSLCAGQGRDVIGVLPNPPRRDDVSAVLVELDPRNVAVARAAADSAGLTQVNVIEGDAAVSDVYAPFVPADVILACGIFGNISDLDIENTARHLSMLCRPGASIVWTRRRDEPDLTPQIREWFREGGFEELRFDAPDNATVSAVGTARLVAPPAPFKPGFRFFTFVQ
jgi:hypothetical protein